MSRWLQISHSQPEIHGSDPDMGFAWFCLGLSVCELNNDRNISKFHIETTISSSPEKLVVLALWGPIPTWQLCGIAG